MKKPLDFVDVIMKITLNEQFYNSKINKPNFC